MAQPLQLEIFYKGKVAESVPEYAEIELRLTNPTANPLQNIAVWLGAMAQIIRRDLELAPGASWSLGYNVKDYAGELIFKAGFAPPDADTRAYPTLAATRLTVIPQKLSLEDLTYIKFERLPTLLARLDAPNGLRLRYDEPDEGHFFDFYSADYTAERLRFFSQAFLEEGLAERLLARLDYATPTLTEQGSDVIRGAVRWPATVQNWLNRPETTHLQHEWTRAPKTFNTALNQLYCHFQNRLSIELQRLLRYIELGGAASERLKTALPEFERRMRQHRTISQARELKEIVTLDLEQSDFNTSWWEKMQRAANQAANPAYRQLLELWRQFSSRFVSLPAADVALAWSGLQPMSKIYELWAVCEIAAALDLAFSVDWQLESAEFAGELAGQPLRLYYNQGLAGGWYSATRPAMPRPDIRLEWGDKPLLLDVKYRVYPNANNTSRARADDVYKMLAYMNDFTVPTGAIIYPGTGDLTIIDGQKGQKLAEIALLPPPNRPNQPDFTRQLRANLLQLLAPTGN